MQDLPIRPEDIISFKEAFKPANSAAPQPVIDTLVSEIVGKPVRNTDPRLIKLIVKWKQERGETNEPDNWFADESRVNELKEAFK